MRSDLLNICTLLKVSPVYYVHSLRGAVWDEYCLNMFEIFRKYTVFPHKHVHNHAFSSISEKLLRDFETPFSRCSHSQLLSDSRYAVFQQTRNEKEHDFE